VITHFNVGGRPRSVDFLPDSSRAFIPSESAGQIHVIDTANYAQFGNGAAGQGFASDVRESFPRWEKGLCGTGRAGTIAFWTRKLTGPQHIKAGTRPWGIIISPDGKLLYSANARPTTFPSLIWRRRRKCSASKPGPAPGGLRCAQAP